MIAWTNVGMGALVVAGGALVVAGGALAALVVEGGHAERHAAAEAAAGASKAEAPATAATAGTAGTSAPPGIADGACYPGIVDAGRFRIFQEALRSPNGGDAKPERGDGEPTGEGGGELPPGLPGQMAVSDRYCLLQVLEFAPPDVVVTWRSLAFGARYRVRAASPFQDAEGRVCREYALGMAADETLETRRPRGCRDRGGEWRFSK